MLLLNEERTHAALPWPALIAALEVLTITMATCEHARSRQA
ncbi:MULTISPECIES: hypothetical protein [unclassified Rhizobium]|nr:MULTISPECIES: hypothetical protein [unclassified Rhizobium]